MGGEVCMWNGEDHLCTSVEGDNNVGDWCKQYGPMEAAQCQQDPKCMWEAADGECDAAKFMPLLPGVGTPTTGSTSGFTTAGLTTGGTVGAGFTTGDTTSTSFTTGTVTGSDSAGTVTGFTSAGGTSAGSMTGETSAGGTSAGSMTGETSAGVTSAGATSSGSTAGSTAPGSGTPTLNRMPCKMRPMAQCTGLSPTGGHCYFEEGKCDESEAG